MWCITFIDAHMGTGDELPDGFELVRYDPNSGLPNRLIGENGSIRLSTSVIFGLLVVAITDPSNADQSIPLDYFLLLEHMKFFVHDWWGGRGTSSGLPLPMQPRFLS